MERFICFAHNTRIGNVPSILKTGRLMTSIEKCGNGTRGKGLYVDDADCDIILSQPDQFPGLYLNGVCAHEAGSNKYASSSSSTVMLVFPVDLLLQANWHFNLIDQNGMINRNTFCRLSMDQIPNMHAVEAFYRERSGSYPGNELVMHDGLPTKLLAAVWVHNEKTKGDLMALLETQRITCPVPIRVMKRVPSKPLRTSQQQHLDETARPVLSYFLDINYTGIKYPAYV